MLYHLSASINNLEHCLNMETLCSSTTNGTACAAAVPERKKKKGGEKRDLLVKTVIYLSSLHQHHWAGTRTNPAHPALELDSLLVWVQI